MSHSLTTDERKARIVDLLEHYRDVVPGLHGGSEWDANGSPDSHAQLAGGVWNHSSYQQLERLRLKLREVAPRPYWHLAEFYFRAGTKRIARCQRCGREAPWDKVGVICNHGKRHHPEPKAMVVAIGRVTSASVDPIYVELAVCWLAHKWRGRPRFVAEILAELEEQKRKAAA